jgi:uncharacterized protein YneF (UPF0154 family)
VAREGNIDSSNCLSEAATGLFSQVNASDRHTPNSNGKTQVQPGRVVHWRSNMMKQRNMVLAVLVVVVLFAIGAIVGTAFAQKTAVPKLQDSLALGEEQVKQLLLLMDTDENGKISKQEWMKFMEAEFERLDKNKTGELDVKDLKQSKLQATPFTKAGK